MDSILLDFLKVLGCLHDAIRLSNKAHGAPLFLMRFCQARVQQVFNSSGSSYVWKGFEKTGRKQSLSILKVNKPQPTTYP